jgi:hypothetical protein
MNSLIFPKDRYLAIAFLFFAFSTICSAAAWPPTDDLSFLLEVHREGGFFPNPTYTLTIFGNGHVKYLGIAHVHSTGKRDARVSLDAVQKLSNQVSAAHFFDLPAFDNTSCQEHDSPTSTLRVRLDGHEKSVGTCGAPDAVGEIIAAAETAARVSRWTFFDPQELQLQIAHGWRVADHLPQFMEEAIAWQDADIIRLLAQHGADVNGLNSNHEHFLMGAVRSGNVAGARILVELGANWKIEDGGESPATNAGYRTSEMLKLFLDRGADVNAVSTAGATMLMAAASQTNPATVKFLVEHGADVNLRNARGETALSVAQEYNRKYWHGSSTASQESREIIGYLIAHGAQSDQTEK